MFNFKLRRFWINSVSPTQASDDSARYPDSKSPSRLANPSIMHDEITKKSRSSLRTTSERLLELGHEIPLPTHGTKFQQIIPGGQKEFTALKFDLRHMKNSTKD